MYTYNRKNIYKNNNTTKINKFAYLNKNKETKKYEILELSSVTLRQ